MTVPSYPSQPGDGAPAPYPVPSEIMYSFWCYLGSALVWVVSAVMVFGERPALVSAFRTVYPQFTADQIQSLAQRGIILTFVAFVIIGLLVALFAFRLKQGRNWARITLTVLAVAALVVLLLAGGSFVNLIGELATVAGCVLSFLPKSNAYVNAMRRARLGL